MQGLEPNTEYGVAVFEVDGSNGNQRYLVTEYINQLVKTASAPTVSTSSLLFNSLGSTSVNLSWTNGNGEGRMVVLRSSQPSTFTPTVLSTHGTSSSNFASTTNNLPNSHKHMYRGAATTVTLTNLLPATTYHLAFFEYNGLGQPVYTSIPLTGLFTTLPTSGLAIGGFDAITFCPSQQVDVPYVHTGLLNAGNVLSVELSDITGSFAAPTILGTQSTTNTSGFITSTLPASLPEGMGYRLRVRATNPASLSADNGANLQITTSVQPTFTVVGGQVSSCGAPIQLTTSQLNYNLQWFRNGQPIVGATTSSHFATQTGSYQVRIAGASGGCQLLSTATAITITQEPAFNFLFAASYCVIDVINLAPLSQPTGGTLSGPGIVSGVFNAATAGIGQHLITYTYVDAVSLCSFSKITQIMVTALPSAPTTTAGSGCQLTGISLVASGATVNESYEWYTVASGGTPIAGATLATFTTPPLTANTSFYVSIVSAAGCVGPRAEVIATVTTVTAPTATGASSCPGIFTLTASDGTNGQYKWYTAASGGTAIAGEVNSSFTTPSISATTTYYVSINDGTCESIRTSVVATISSTLSAPTTTGSSSCGTGVVTLNASGGTNGQYRWYTVATGGTAITGEVNSSFTTPSISSTTIYYVSINDGTCESLRSPVVATINTVPAKPIVTTSGSTTLCSGQSVTLTAPVGFTYSWSTGATSQQITVSTAGSFSVQITNSGCTSVSSDPIVVSNGVCNQPPVIAAATAQTEVEGFVTLTLTGLLSDPDNNLDLSTLRIIQQPSSGAPASINSNNDLIINYQGLSFAGIDELTIEVCDLSGECVQRIITIDVVGDIITYNAISPNDDNKNPAFILKYIEAIEETKNNKVSIFNRWGDLVWEGINYNNTSVVFTGTNKNGNELPSGTYFYKIEFASGRKTDSGYLSLKR